ncbi:MAG: penicillin-resistant DD-carboxypeptidase [Thermoleophilia bacterium]|nr:penicillin-resistant DD-carboxypeptidase [Thermoleophilia bacterium]
MGYDQALARVTELRALTSGAPAPAATPTPDSGSAAAFQQQLAMAGGNPTAPAGGFTPEVMAALGGGDPYAAMQGGGLSAQAAMLGQLGMGGAVPAAPANVTGKTAGLDPELLQRLDAVGRELGAKVDIISGQRSYEEQARLYAAYQNGTGNLAAKPGTSNHEHGGAADAYVNGVALADVDGAREIAARHGLHFPVGGESWHVERTDR